MMKELMKYMCPKLKQCFLIVFTLLCFTVCGQISKGSNNAEFGIGFSGIGVAGYGYYVKGFNNTIFGQFGGGIEVAQQREVGYRSFYLDGLISTQAFALDNKGSFVTTIGGGLSFYVDNIDQFPNDLTEKVVSANYGLTVVPEIVMASSRKLSIVMSAHLRYTIRPTFNVTGNFRYNVGIGLRLRL